MVQSLHLEDESQKESETLKPPPFDRSFNAKNITIPAVIGPDGNSSQYRRPVTQGKQRQRRFDPMNDSNLKRIKMLSALGKSLRIEKMPEQQICEEKSETQILSNTQQVAGTPDNQTLELDSNP